jgi:membrane-bound lytic murein transglycosylase D
MTGKKPMPKPIPETLTALFLASALGACAWLPAGSTGDTADSRKGADTPYVDYWQTRDPSEYRQRATGSANPSAVQSSPDVVLARPPAPAAKIQSKPEPRIVRVIPVSNSKAARPPEALAAGKPALAAPADPKATPTKARLAAVPGRQKHKGQSTSIASRDLWGRMRGRLALAEVEHPRIVERIDYLKRNPGYLNLFAERARPYLYYIVEHIDRSRLPLDLALVPMVESAFEPTAVSPKEAAGLWQIIPTTGQEWGLTLAEGYDGRLDIHTSTDVALRYLRYLHKLFDGDWLLALAAYNAGPRAVQDAIKAQASQPLSPPAPTVVETHPAVVRALALSASPRAVASAREVPQSLFWSLKLPKETQDYVPRIVALAHIIADPGAHGVKLQAIANQPYLFRIDLTPETRVLDSVAAAGIPVEEFFRFNPGFKPGVEPPAYAYKLLLPRERAQTLVAHAPGARLLAPSKHTVRKGETLAMIAKRHGVPSEQLAQWNGLDGKDRLKAGQQLIVYPPS